MGLNGPSFDGGCGEHAQQNYEKNVCLVAGRKPKGEDTLLPMQEAVSYPPPSGFRGHWGSSTRVSPEEPLFRLLLLFPS